MSLTLDKILVVDLETTCDEPRPTWQGEVTEIGIAVLNCKNLEIESLHSTFVVPTSTPVTPFCTQLTTITPEMVSKANGARTFPEAIKWLEQFNARDTVWASWGDFDRKQFERQCRDEHVKYPFGPNHINVKTLFALFNQMKRGIGTKEAVEVSGLTWKGTHHRGVDDAENIAGLLAAILRKGRNK